MHQEFIILTLETNLAEKKIIVTTNNTIDPNSVDDILVEVTERESKSQVTFTKEIIGSNLEVTLTQWPLPNSSYIFYLKSLKNILGEDLRAGIKRKVEFKSEITREVEIVSPSMHEQVNSLDVQFEVIKQGEAEDKIETSILLEVSTDNAFFNIVKSTKVSDDRNNITLTSLKNGQYFLRARLQSDKESFQYGKWSKVISFVYGRQDCETTPDEDLDYLPEYDDMSPEIDDIVDFEINCSVVQGQTPNNILLIANKNFNEDNFYQSQVLITGKEGAIKHSCIMSDNKIEIELIDKLKDNSTYTIKLINIESISGDVYSQDIKFATRMKPMYCELEAVTALIGDFKIPDEVILYHIREASKFADYLVASECMIIDEENIPFVVTQLVKYYAAHECLLRHTIDLSSSLGLKGVVGNVSFEEKETTKDITKFLSHFCKEIEKWKEAVRGYELEGRARMQTTVRGRYASPSIQPLNMNGVLTFGRGDLYGQ